jgi:hypothetical protein
MGCLKIYYAKQSTVVNVTLSLPEDVVRKLRMTVKERYGGRKGALSGLVKDALEEHIASLESTQPAAGFKALQQDRVVAEGGSLDELSSMLQKRGVDPRGVRIVSATPLRQVVRAGLRGKSSRAAS